METVHPDRRDVDEAATRQANRLDWDAYADEYQTTHGEFLRDIGFVWGPEGLQEADARVLGDPAGRRCLEVGCGAAQCSRWLVTQGATAVGLDLSRRQLQHAQRLNEATGVDVRVVQGTATALPFHDDTFDIVFSAFGALQFVSNARAAVAEAARVLRPGGRFAFSVTHPIRWAMPDDPKEGGLIIDSSYFDRTPYVEVDDSGTVRYVEHHRTLGDWVGLLSHAGFALEELYEPEWPAGHDRIWGGWGPVRGALIPGTAIFSGNLIGREHLTNRRR